MKPGNIDYDLTLLPTLQAEGQPAVTLVDPRTQTDYFTWNTSGTLPAGVYIYSGNLNESQRLGGGNDRYRSEVVSYLDMKLTVAPEPAALALLGAGACCHCPAAFGGGEGSSVNVPPWIVVRLLIRSVQLPPAILPLARRWRMRVRLVALWSVLIALSARRRLRRLCGR